MNDAIQCFEDDVEIMTEYYLSIGLVEKVLELINCNKEKSEIIMDKYSEYFEKAKKVREKYIEDNHKSCLLYTSIRE